MNKRNILVILILIILIILILFAQRKMSNDNYEYSENNIIDNMLLDKEYDEMTSEEILETEKIKNVNKEDDNYYQKSSDYDLKNEEI